MTLAVVHPAGTRWRAATPTAQRRRVRADRTRLRERTGGGPHEQADEAIFPVISADGRYRGVRRRLRRHPRHLAARPRRPARSNRSHRRRDDAVDQRRRALCELHDREQLVPEDTNNSPDVYVRDMERRRRRTRIRARLSGERDRRRLRPTHTRAKTYRSRPNRKKPNLARSRARARRSARTDSYVVFVTTAESDLLGDSEPTPALEVLVRDLATDETKLVSAEYEPARAPRQRRRQARPAADRRRQRAVRSGLPRRRNIPLSTPAATPEPRTTRATGSAPRSAPTARRVAWMGQELEEQTQLLPGEQSTEEPQRRTAVAAHRRSRDLPRSAASPAARTRRTRHARPAASRNCRNVPSLLDPCAGPFEHYRQGNVREGLWGTKVESRLRAAAQRKRHRRRVHHRRARTCRGRIPVPPGRIDRRPVHGQHGRRSHEGAGAAPPDSDRRRRRDTRKDRKIGAHHRLQRLAGRQPSRVHHSAHRLSAGLARLCERTSSSARGCRNCSMQTSPTTRSPASPTAY